MHDHVNRLGTAPFARRPIPFIAPLLILALAACSSPQSRKKKPPTAVSQTTTADGRAVFESSVVESPGSAPVDPRLSPFPYAKVTLSVLDEHDAVAQTSQSPTPEQRRGFRFIRSSCAESRRCEAGDPFLFVFDADVDPRSVAFSVQPEIPHELDVHGRVVALWAETKAGTTYTVALGEVASSGGESVEVEPQKFSIVGHRWGARLPRQKTIVLPRGTASLPIRGVDDEPVKAWVYKVAPTDYDAFIEHREKTNRHLVGNKRQFALGEPPGEQVWHETVLPREHEFLELREVGIPLGAALQDGGGHAVVILSQGEGEPFERWWVQVSDLEVRVLFDWTKLHVFVSRQHDATPVEGARVELVGAPSPVTTDASGYAAIERAPQKKGPDYGLLRVSHDGDTRVIHEGATRNSRWSKDERSAERQAELQKPAPLWAVATTPSQPRPGETVRVTGWLRRAVRGVAVETPDRGTRVKWALRSGVDWTRQAERAPRMPRRGTPFEETGETKTADDGSFDFEVTLPSEEAGTPNGLVLELPDETEGERYYTLSFGRRHRSQKSAKPPDLVPLQISGLPAVAGEEVTIELDGPANTEVKWLVETFAASDYSAAYPDFEFHRMPSFIETKMFGGEQMQRVRATGKTDGDGLVRTTLKLIDFSIPRARRVDITATAHGEPLARGSIHVASSARQIGVRAPRFIVDGSVDVDVIVVDLDGEPAAGARFVLELWPESGDGVVERCVGTSAEKPVVCRFDAKASGVRHVVATVTDDEGREHRSRFTTFVTRRDDPEALVDYPALVAPGRATVGSKLPVLVATPGAPAMIWFVAADTHGVDQVVGKRVETPFGATSFELGDDYVAGAMLRAIAVTTPPDMQTFGIGLGAYSKLNVIRPRPSPSLDATFDGDELVIDIEAPALAGATAFVHVAALGGRDGTKFGYPAPRYDGGDPALLPYPNDTTRVGTLPTLDELLAGRRDDARRRIAQVAQTPPQIPDRERPTDGHAAMHYGNEIHMRTHTGVGSALPVVAGRAASWEPGAPVVLRVELDEKGRAKLRHAVSWTVTKVSAYVVGEAPRAVGRARVFVRKPAR